MKIIKFATLFTVIVFILGSCRDNITMDGGNEKSMNETGVNWDVIAFESIEFKEQNLKDRINILNSKLREIGITKKIIIDDEDGNNLSEIILPPLSVKKSPLKDILNKSFSATKIHYDELDGNIIICHISKSDELEDRTTPEVNDPFIHGK